MFLEISQNPQKTPVPEVCNFIKKEILAQCFPVNFVNFLRTPFIIEHLWWLLLSVAKVVLDKKLYGFIAKAQTVDCSVINYSKLFSKKRIEIFRLLFKTSEESRWYNWSFLLFKNIFTIDQFALGDKWD